MTPEKQIILKKIMCKVARFRVRHFGSPESIDDRIINCVTAESPMYQVKYGGGYLCTAIDPCLESAKCPYHVGSVYASQMIKMDTKKYFRKNRTTTHYVCGRGK